MGGSTPDETFRGTMQGHTPGGDYATVIVTRQGRGSAGRVWLTFNGAIKTTVVMTNPETAQLGKLLDKATLAQ
jgi:biotin-(acetyl-CoA carboxylase) ligase